MSSLTTKAIPFLVILLVSGTLAFETACECDIDLESYLPLMIAMGLSGIPYTLVKKSIEAKKAINTEKFRDSINKD